MPKENVIAIIDVGKTNKKLFLFDQHYQMLYEQSAQLVEAVDGEGDTCENLENLRTLVFNFLREVFLKKEFEIKAVNFSTYGASFVYIGAHGLPVAPLYNYLKPYPETLHQQFYQTYGGEEAVSLQTSSPVLGSLNSGLQLYRLKYEKPALFQQINYALHLPQYLSYLISDIYYSDITSIGCHTSLWNFPLNNYHHWVHKEGIIDKLAPLAPSSQTVPASFPGGRKSYAVGIGLHDSSAALIPYLVSFQEPFVLISTGTWCISLNPFNQQPLTAKELRHDCLCYLQYNGKPVKASRLFAGNEHEEQVKRISDYFHQNVVNYRSMEFNPAVMDRIQKVPIINPSHLETKGTVKWSSFAQRDLSQFESDEEAYHQLMFDIMEQQSTSTQLVIHNTHVKRIFVDGGFSKNKIYMNMLAAAFPQMEVFAASMAQSSALGTALAIHQSWNSSAIPNDLVELKYFHCNIQLKF
jgi:sugar (pentulose or hexulose) kinase